MAPGGFVGSVHILLASVLAAAVCRGTGAIVLFLLMGLLWTVRRPCVLRVVARRSFLVFAGIIAISAIIAASGSMTPAVRLLVLMLSKAATVMWAVTGFAATATLENLACLGSRVGIVGLGFAVGTAANAMSRSMADIRDIWWTIRMRRNGKPRCRDWQRMAVTVLARTSTRADEMLLAAEARGLDPEGAAAETHLTTSADLWWSLVAWSVAAAAVLSDYYYR